MQHPLTTLPRLEASVTGLALCLPRKQYYIRKTTIIQQKSDPDSGLRDTPARSIVPSAFYKSRQLFLIVRIFPAPAVRKDTLSVWFTSEKKKK
jgi:hypothetical protein